MALGTRVQTRPVVFALSFRGKSWAAFGNEEAVSDKTILENRGLSTSYPGSLTRTNSRWRTHLFPFCAYPIKRLVLVLTTRNAPSGGSKTSRARARKLWRHKWFSTCYAKCKMRAVCFDCSYNAAPVIKFFFIRNVALFVRDFERKAAVNALKRPPGNGLLSQGKETNPCSYTVLHCRLRRRRRQRKPSRR